MKKVYITLIIASIGLGISSCGVSKPKNNKPPRVVKAKPPKKKACPTYNCP